MAHSMSPLYAEFETLNWTIKCMDVLHGINNICNILFELTMTMCSPKNDSFFFKHIGKVSNIFAIPFFPCANYKNTDKLEQNV